MSEPCRIGSNFERVLSVVLGKVSFISFINYQSVLYSNTQNTGQINLFLHNSSKPFHFI